MTNKPGKHAVKPNPTLKPFEALIGAWRTVGSHPYFPGIELHGRAVFEWTAGGAFLLTRSEIDHPKFPDGVAVFGSDGEAGSYYQLYFDERGISRKYDVAIAGNQIKWWRDDAHLSQRFTMTIEKDKLVSTGEMARDSGSWEQDLSLTYIR